MRRVTPHEESMHALYLRHGFAYCEPFGKYVPDLLSVFMTKRIP
jgi:hypothetical protein